MFPVTAVTGNSRQKTTTVLSKTQITIVSRVRGRRTITVCLHRPRHSARQCVFFCLILTSFMTGEKVGMELLLRCSTNIVWDSFSLQVNDYWETVHRRAEVPEFSSIISHFVELDSILLPLICSAFLRK
jgi:hypothetical protein